LNVYDLTGGNVERIGEVSACTAAHRGEASEAWGVVLAKRPGILRTLRKRAAAKGDSYLRGMVERDGGYYAWQFRELGVELHAL
jgi:hypothetical protein